jgi:hypothetical protein
MAKQLPKDGDYVQLLDENLEPCENFTYASKWVSELGYQLFLIEDFRGEWLTVTRDERFDDGDRKGWQEVATATA